MNTAICTYVLLAIVEGLNCPPPFEDMPLSLTSYWTNTVIFWWNGEQRMVACNDAFGRESYRQPFYHDGYGLWVIPVDVFSPEPIHGLVWEWQLGNIEVNSQ